MVDLLRGLLVLLSLVLLAGCAHGGREEAPPDRPREMAPREAAAAEREGSTARDPRDEGVATAAEREVDEDRALAMDTGAGTPQRRASLRVVEEGKGYLIAGRARDAAQRFTRATQIDPTNGFAYYYLGRARIAAGDRRGAVGVLQKAESLLGPYPEWREATQRLLDRLGAS